MSIPFLIFNLIVLIFSAIVHEVAHGYEAERLGDDTARKFGRLTLNPIPHIDPFGSIILPALLFLSGSPVVLGWAKPVPYNPGHLHKDYKYGPIKVALAGPLANLSMLLAFGLIARFGSPYLDWRLTGLFGFIALINTALAVFNLVPIPPLDGSKLLTIFAPRYAVDVERFGIYGILLVFVFIMLFSSVIYYIVLNLFMFVAGGGVVDAMARVLGLFGISL